MATSRKKTDEKNLKLLRELGAQASNRTCFDCHQKGPTYINMTIGSFICTSCSGILRGLNPPHRVKSISMASFTQEEIDQIKAKGNKYCEAVWMGLFDEKSNLFPDSKDEQKIRDFMVSKYEKKRFYVEPSIATKNMINRMSKSDSSSNASTPGSDTKSFGVTNGTTQPTTNISKPLMISSNSLPQMEKMKPSSSLDLFTVASTTQNSDPFAPQEPITSSSSRKLQKEAGFANFENANIYSSSTGAFTSKNPPPLAHPSPFSSNPLTPMSSTGTNQPASASFGIKGATAPPPAQSASAEDRYAALKDLDEAFKFQKDHVMETDKPAGTTSTMYGAPFATAFGANVNGIPQTPQNSSTSLFGTSPLSGGAFVNQSNSQAWNSPAFPANPFSGTLTNNNKVSPPSWTNGAGSFPSTGEAQPNPFAGGADTNFNNQFAPAALQMNCSNTATSNANWANFGSSANTTTATPPFASAKMAPNPWGASETSANPFSSPNLPSSGSHYNPFL